MRVDTTICKDSLTRRLEAFVFLDLEELGRAAGIVST